jgi:hypothetical protein
MRRNLDVYSESFEVDLDTVKEVENGVIVSATIVGYLRSLSVISIHSEGKRLHTARRTPMLVRIAFAGEKRYRERERGVKMRR